MGDGPDQGDEWEFKPTHTEELLERSRLEALFEARARAAEAIRESEALYESLGTQISRQRLASEFFFSGGHDTSPRHRQLYMDQRISAQGFRLINQLLEDLSIMLPVRKKGSDEAEGKYEDLIISSD